MKTKILVVLLIGFLAASFGIQANALLQQGFRTNIANSFNLYASITGGIIEPNGGGDSVPGPGVPR